MSKSLGNVTTPMPLLETHGADALRYWAASGRPGVDTALDEAQMKIGRRLAIKMLNASKFVLGRLETTTPLGVERVTEPLDRDILSLLGNLIADASTAFTNYDYARALERSESFFWSFCDNYVELVKVRAYGENDDPATNSARATLSLCLSTLQRLFAPILPFVSEEVWRWWHEDSVHRANWPAVGELEGLVVPERVGFTYQSVSDVLEALRREKSTAKVSQRARVATLTLAGPSDWTDTLRSAERDLKDAGTIDVVTYVTADEISVDVVLA
jgi:valyl-tRNA synthetase